MQGAVFDQRKQSFFQLLFFISKMRVSGRRPVSFIGISRTGLTKIMVYRIARAIRTLPIQIYEFPPTILEMQKVGVGPTLFLCILFRTLTESDIEVSRRWNWTQLRLTSFAIRARAGTLMFA